MTTTWRVEDAWRRARLGSGPDRRDLAIMSACVSVGAALVAASSHGVLVGLAVWCGLLSLVAVAGACATWRASRSLRREAARGLDELQEYLQSPHPPAPS